MGELENLLKPKKLLNLEWKALSLLPPAVVTTIIALTIPLPNQHYRVGLNTAINSIKYIKRKYFS